MFLFICKNILYQARHIFFIAIIIIIVLLVCVPLVAIESDDLRAVTELHVGVAEDSKTLEEDLLAGDLLLAGHPAHLGQNISIGSQSGIMEVGGPTGNSIQELFEFSKEMQGI